MSVVPPHMVTGNVIISLITFSQTLSQSRLGRSIIITQINHKDVTAGVTPIRRHMMDDNVTDQHAKVTQVGAVGIRCFPCLL